MAGRSGDSDPMWCSPRRRGYLGIEQRQDFSPAHLDKALAASLRRLDTDHLDLYQLHSPDLQGPHELDGAWAWMEAARASGKIRALGISARSPSEALVAIGHFRPMRSRLISTSPTSARASWGSLPGRRRRASD